MLEKVSAQFSSIIKKISGQSKITEKNVEEAVESIKIALLEADVNLRVVRRFINHTLEAAKGETVLRSVNPGQQFVKIVYDRMVALLGDTKAELSLKGPDTQSVLLMMGLQGSGKTTSAAKLAYRLKNEGRRPLLVAADLVRPAAVKQLRVLGQQAGVPVFATDDKKPVKVVKEALQFAKKNQFDSVIIDTSGRLHVDSEMMAELKEVAKAANPVEKLLVADSMTGQNAVSIAGEFDTAVGITGVVLTKFDSDTRGGAALSLKSVTGKPLLFVGVGEKLDHLEPFYPDRMASRILGMGDVVSLVEKAQQTIEREEAQALQKKMAKAAFTLQDYLDQFQRVKKMGSMKNLLELIPGAAGRLSEDDIDTRALKKEEAIILSMTPGERENPRILGPNRKRRVALGSGSTVFDVNRLLKKFEQSKLMMKKVSKNKSYQQQLFSQFGGNSY